MTSTMTATSSRHRQTSCPRSSSTASDRCRQPGHDKAAGPPDSERLRADTRKRPHTRKRPLLGERRATKLAIRKPLLSRVADGIRTRFFRYHKPVSTRGAAPAFWTAATGNPQIHGISGSGSFSSSASSMGETAEEDTDLRNPQTLIGPCSSHFSQSPEHSAASRGGARKAAQVGSTAQRRGPAGFTAAETRPGFAFLPAS